MGKFKDALKDFKQVLDQHLGLVIESLWLRIIICLRVLPLFCQVVKIVPKDPDAIKKLRECEKAVQKLRFEEAIATTADNHSIVDSVDYESMCNV